MAHTRKNLIRPRPSSKSARLAAAICLALAAITFAVFGQTLRHDFVNFDDNDYVFNNPVVAHGLTRQGIIWAFTGVHASNWHPLTWLSHMLDCQLYGLHPAGHHLTNVLLHTATVIGLFLVLRQMTGAVWRSALVAAVFAIHPLRVESVAWVAERKDVLSGFFFVLTIDAYVRYVRHPRSPARYGLVLILFALGLMCKPMLVTLPLVLLLLDYWPLQRGEPARKLVLEKLPLLALSAVSCVITLFAQTTAIHSGGAFSLPSRLGNALVSCVIYLGQMICPRHLAVLYPYAHDGWPAWEEALAGALLACFSYAAWRERRTRPWLLIGWAWYLVMLLPVLGIIQVGGQAHADRYTYLPQVGVYMAVTWLVVNGRWSRFVGGGVVMVLMFCAWKQTAYWQNSVTLWNHTLACTKDNYVAHYSLGDALLQKGQLAEAGVQYELALGINPNYAEAHNGLGTALRRTGHLDEAIAQYQEALNINPRYAEAHNNLAIALRQKGRVDEAIAQYQLALQITPDNESMRFNLAKALLQRGRVDEAITQYQMALQLEPADMEAQNNLAWLLATSDQASLRNGEQAMQLARQADELAHGTNAIILGTLAAAFAEAGQFDNAVQSAQKAIDVARTSGRQDLEAKLNSELQRYRTGHPLHP